MLPNGVNTKLILANTLLDTLTETEAGVLSTVSELLTSLTALATVTTELAGVLNVAIGTFGEAEAGTILATLRQIQQCVCKLAGGAEPVGASPNGCTEPWAAVNARMILSDGYPGRAFVEWDSAVPQGVELSSELDPPLPTGVELHLTASKTYYLWVQSTCPAFTTTPTSESTYPTNEWVAIDGPTYIAVSLEAGCSAKAFLCVDPETGFVDCITRVSNITVIMDSQPDDHQIPRLAVPLDGLGLPLISTFSYGGTTFTADSDITIAESDANGYTFTLIDGVKARVWWKITGAGFFVVYLNSGFTTQVIPDHTDYWGVDNYDSPAGDLEAPFTIEICPPMPE